VVKPANGCSGRGVRLVSTPEELIATHHRASRNGWLLAQSYVRNPGVDIKVYSTGGELHATVQRSPLHPDTRVDGHVVALADDLAELVSDVGKVFGLDLYGVDVVEGPDGWVVVDVNDFPSFSWVPDATARVARAVLQLATEGRPTTSEVAPARGLSGARGPRQHHEKVRSHGLEPVGIRP
jgi:ribosomal protein S6--L-glutamate ligase